MLNTILKNATVGETISVPLVPDLNEILRDADALVELMERETPGVVADLANTLTVSAHEAGAWEIEVAADNVRRVASGHSPVVLTGAIHALTSAISRTGHKRAA